MDKTGKNIPPENTPRKLLSAVAISKAKPQDKAYKLYDEKGLFLLIQPNGSKYWRFKYRYDGKEKTLALGVYPDVSLADARERLSEARKLLSNGTDPSEARKQSRQTSRELQANSFEAIAREWFKKHKPGWSASHSGRIIERLERDVFPWVGSRPIQEINAPDILKVARRIESRGALDTAHRALQNCGQIFRYAVATGRAVRDPCADLRGALPPIKAKHHPSVTDPKKVTELLRAIQSFSGSLVVKCALQFAPLVFVRPGELRQAEWQEIAMDKAEWRIPAHKMKMKDTHIVPLSHQAIEILLTIQPSTGSGKYVFPSLRAGGRPMSENTINAALRRLGYSKEEMTGHGFRSMASTLLHENGWPHDVIERQLAHAERNSVSAAYNYAQHLPERRRMMQWWSDYLTSLLNNVVMLPVHKTMKG